MQSTECRMSRLQVGAKEAGREEYQRDRDRLYHTNALRRLAGVTQVAAVSELQLLHTRLTHSIKVAELAQRLAQHIGRHPDSPSVLGVDSSVAEAAALAHDLGHPPFGHVAEEALHRLMRRWGGFEGNAQTFRVLTKLEVHPGIDRGLNLTIASLGAALKYPQLSSPLNDETKDDEVWAWTNRWRGSKWGAYASELEQFTAVRKEMAEYERTPEAFIMDWADDVAYATHDVEDYIQAGLIPVSPLQNSPERTRLGNYLAVRLVDKPGFKKGHAWAALKVLDDMPERFGNELLDVKALKRWSSDTITRLLIDSVQVFSSEPYLKVDDAVQYQVEALKALTGMYVIDTPTLAIGQEGQVRIIVDLFEILTEWLLSEKRDDRLPKLLKDYLNIFNDDEVGKRNVEREVKALWPTLSGSEKPKASLHASPRREVEKPREWNNREDRPRLAAARAVCDYICSLTEAQAIDLHANLTGRTVKHGFGGWVH